MKNQITDDIMRDAQREKNHLLCLHSEKSSVERSKGQGYTVRDAQRQDNDSDNCLCPNNEKTSVEVNSRKEILRAGEHPRHELTPPRPDTFTKRNNLKGNKSPTENNLDRDKSPTEAVRAAGYPRHSGSQPLCLDICAKNCVEKGQGEEVVSAAERMARAFKVNSALQHGPSMTDHMADKVRPARVFQCICA